MRIRNLFFAGTAALALVFSGCVMNGINPESETIVLRENGPGSALEITVSAGETFSERMQAGPLVFNVLPQIVIWTENGAGELIETLYVSGADYRKLRHAGKNELGEQFYRESFPVWASRAEAAGIQLPSKENPWPDTLTSATPDGSFSLKTVMARPGERITVLAEINKSGDESARYNKETNGWVGQPSLIYAATVVSPPPGGSCRLELLGHGGRLDQDPGIYSDLEGFDSALTQIASIRIVY